MSDEKVKFRKSVSGYNKQDVNEYIESFSRKYERNERDLKKTIEEKNKKIAEFEAACKNSEESERIIAELNEKLDSLKSENESLSDANNKLGVRIAELEKDAELNKEAYEKSGIYDKVSEQIGSMIINANAKAESIVGEAELRAKVKANAMLDDMTDELKAFCEKYSDAISCKMQELSETISNLAGDTLGFSSAMEGQIESDRQMIKRRLGGGNTTGTLQNDMPNDILNALNEKYDNAVNSDANGSEER